MVAVSADGSHFLSKRGPIAKIASDAVQPTGAVRYWRHIEPNFAQPAAEHVLPGQRAAEAAEGAGPTSFPTRLQSRM